MEKTVLGLDIGTNSIGWALLKTNENDQPIGILDLGVRIFSDGRNPKDKTTLAASRRQKRHERRRRDRTLFRRKLIRNQLVRMGLFPAQQNIQDELKELNVLALRASAADLVLPKFEIGRVIMHLSLRRGFKSGRKDATEEDRKTKISERIANLKAVLEGDNLKTVGQYLNKRNQMGLLTKGTIETGFHLLRSMIEDEFDQIRRIQSTKYIEITGAEWDRLRGLIFFQRPLKAVERGNCSIFSERPRAYRSSPAFESYRFLSELFNLRYLDSDLKEISLSSSQVVAAFEEFKYLPKLRFKKLRTFLKLPDISFTIEPYKDDIKISKTNSFFDDLLSTNWRNLPLSLQVQIHDLMVEEEKTDSIYNKLSVEFGLSLDISEKLSKVILPPLSDSTVSYSDEALIEVVRLALLEKRSPRAVVDDLILNEKKQSDLFDYLPYYGQVISDSTQPIPKSIQASSTTLNSKEKIYGRIANPTVHAGLRQLQLLVNETMKRYGKPYSIHIEFARDVSQSEKEKNESERRRKINEKINEEADAFIEQHGQPSNRANRERVRLWKELGEFGNQICVYSGATISANMVLSDQVQIDHILPFSRTLDDSRSNKVLVLASRNVEKADKTPFERWGNDAEMWSGIVERASRLPHNKVWRFAENAISRFEGENDFLARQLNDTRYISKIAKKYLGVLVPDNRIVVTKGISTSLIRGKLGISKDRNKNDEHHAIDAAVVAITSRSFLRRLATLNSYSKSNPMQRIKVEPPWPSFKSDLEECCRKMIVSRKVDHDRNGEFMAATAYGFINRPTKFEEENGYALTMRKPIAIAMNNPGVIRDKMIRQSITENKIEDESFKKIKTVVMYKATREKDPLSSEIKNTLALVSHGKNNEHIKIYEKGANNYLAIWRLPKEIQLRSSEKKRKSDFIFTPVKTIDLNIKSHNELRPHPAAKLLCKVYLGDTVAISNDAGQTEFYSLRSININESNQKISISPINGGPTQNQQIAGLEKLNFRKVFVSPSGIVKDSGSIFV